MIKRLRDIFAPPDYGDSEKNRIASFLNTIILVTILIAGLVGIIDAFSGAFSTLYGMLGVIALLVFDHWLLRAGKLGWASYVLLLGMTFAITGLLAIGQGIHDIGIIDYMLILIIASYLLKRNGIFWMLGIIIASVAVIVLGEIYHFLPVCTDPEFFKPRIADFLIVSLTLLIGTIGISVFSRTMTEALEKAKQSELRWRLLVENAPSVIMILDREGIIRFINGAAIHLPTHYKDKPVFEFLPEEYWPVAKRMLENLRNGESRSENYDLPVRDVNGEWRWYSLQAGPVYQPGQEVSGIIVIATDIQNQKDAAKELQDNRETLKRQAEQLTLLNKIGRSMSMLQDLDSVLDTAYRELSGFLSIDAFYIALYHAENETVSYPLMIDDGKKWQEAPTPLDPDSVLEIAIQTRLPRLVNRTREEVADLESGKKVIHPLGERSKVSASIMMAPMQYGGRVSGVLSAQSYQLDAYTPEDLMLLAGAANQIAIAIENARLYNELQIELSERKRAEAEVRDLNTELEARVRERTAELESANKELASFTYTISHDLRTPIRGIHGMSHILLEQHGTDLSTAALNYIHRIQGNARQMGQLIDDLLAFTHLGRQPVFKVNINMKEMAKQIFLDLKEYEQREIHFKLHSMPPAYADRALIRQVWTNFIENSIKFTAETTNAEIEVGSLEQAGEIVYYVRDNGAGFNMNYYSKLFGMFQRLHRQDEFEGTGVGLAIAKRIIERHGGRVWGEGQVNAGATFYFTLPPNQEPSK